MGGKTGPKPFYHDDEHVKQRKSQRKYDRAIAKIRKEKGCGFKEAQRIHRKRKYLAGLKEIERQEKERRKK